MANASARAVAKLQKVEDNTPTFFNYVPAEYTVQITQKNFQVLSVVGDFFYITALSISDTSLSPVCLISPVGLNNFITYQTGKGLRLGALKVKEKPVGFQGITIQNPTTATITVTVVIGYEVGATVIDNTLNFLTGANGVPISTVERKTLMQAYSGTSIVGGASIAFNTTPGGCFYRKTWYCSNLDPALPLRIKDQSGNTFGNIPAGNTYCLDSSDQIYLFNPNGATVNICCGETFYLA